MMTFQEFQILHSETIGYFQLIESDLKWIYSLMHNGNIGENYDSLDKRNLGFVIKELKELDYSAGTPFISKNDYNFLNQMREKRNYWCHQAYIDFMYIENFQNSLEFQKVCSKLQRDHDRIEVVQRNVEKAKLNANKVFSRN